MDLNQNPKVRKYISDVCSQVKNNQVHEEIRLELLSHIQEIASEYLSEGATQDEAIDKALGQMGDAGLVGRQLNKIHRLAPEWSVLVLAGIFTVLGLSAMYFIQTKGVLMSNLEVFNRSMAFTLLGIVAGCGLYFFDYTKIKAFSLYIYAATLFVLMYVVIWGIHINGVSAFLAIGPLTVNYVEISPYLFTISISGLFVDLNWNKPKQVLYGLALSVIPAVLMLATPSFSAFVTYSVTLIILMIVSGIKLSHMFAMIVSGVGLFSLYLVTSHYRIQRLLGFINRYKDPYGAGYIYMQLNKITHSAGFFGQGFTLDPKVLPDLHTDFVFTYIVYTFGWASGIVLAALALTFLIRIARIAAMMRDGYGKLLVSGFAAVFSVQFLWSIMMNLGFAPITGVNLPFISFGGSQFLASMASIGIILNVYRQRSWFRAGV